MCMPLGPRRRGGRLRTRTTKSTQIKKTQASTDSKSAKDKAVKGS